MRATGEHRRLEGRLALGHRDRAEHLRAVPERDRPGGGRRADRGGQGRPVALGEVAVVGADRDLARQPLDGDLHDARRAGVRGGVTVVGRGHGVRSPGLSRGRPHRLATTDRHRLDDLAAVLEGHRSGRGRRGDRGREDRLATVGVRRRARGELGRRRRLDGHHLGPGAVGVEVVDEQQALRLVRGVRRVVATDVQGGPREIRVGQRVVVTEGSQRGRGHAERQRSVLGAHCVDIACLGRGRLHPVLDLGRRARDQARVLQHAHRDREGQRVAVEHVGVERAVGVVHQLVVDHLAVVRALRVRTQVDQLREEVVVVVRRHEAGVVDRCLRPCVGRVRLERHEELRVGRGSAPRPVAAHTEADEPRVRLGRVQVRRVVQRDVRAGTDVTQVGGTVVSQRDAVDHQGGRAAGDLRAGALQLERRHRRLVAAGATALRDTQAAQGQGAGLDRTRARHRAGGCGRHGRSRTGSRPHGDTECAARGDTGRRQDHPATGVGAVAALDPEVQRVGRRGGVLDRRQCRPRDGGGDLDVSRGAGCQADLAGAERVRHTGRRVSGLVADRVKRRAGGALVDHVHGLGQRRGRSRDGHRPERDAHRTRGVLDVGQRRGVDGCVGLDPAGTDPLRSEDRTGVVRAHEDVLRRRVHDRGLDLLGGPARMGATHEGGLAGHVRGRHRRAALGDALVARADGDGERGHARCGDVGLTLAGDADATGREARDLVGRARVSTTVTLLRSALSSSR